VVKVIAEGHDYYGDLICRISINALSELETVYRAVMRRVGGGDDIVYLDTCYMTARQWTILPQGVNGPQIPLHEFEDVAFAIDPSRSVLYFSVCFESDDYLEDESDGVIHPDFTALVSAFLHQDAFTFAILRSETLAIIEIEKMLR